MERENCWYSVYIEISLCLVIMHNRWLLNIQTWHLLVLAPSIGYQIIIYTATARQGTATATQFEWTSGQGRDRTSISRQRCVQPLLLFSTKKGKEKNKYVSSCCRTLVPTVPVRWESFQFPTRRKIQLHPEIQRRQQTVSMTDLSTSFSSFFNKKT